jgi:hypothetical protein
MCAANWSNRFTRTFGYPANDLPEAEQAVPAGSLIPSGLSSPVVSEWCVLGTSVAARVGDPARAVPTPLRDEPLQAKSPLRGRRAPGTAHPQAARLRRDPDRPRCRVRLVRPRSPEPRRVRAGTRQPRMPGTPCLAHRTEQGGGSSRTSSFRLRPRSPAQPAPDGGQPGRRHSCSAPTRYRDRLAKQRTRRRWALPTRAVAHGTGSTSRAGSRRPPGKHPPSHARRPRRAWPKERHRY